MCFSPFQVLKLFVSLGKHHYSVPKEYIGKRVDIVKDLDEVFERAAQIDNIVLLYLRDVASEKKSPNHSKTRKIMETNNKSISEVAYELGFKYPHCLSRLFKKVTGYTPNEYRQGRS